MGAIKFRSTVLTLAVAAAGGLLFTLLGLPASWLTGAMFAVAALAMAGARVDIYPPIRNLGFLVLGGSLGTSVTPQMVEGVRHWPATMAAIVVSVGLMLAASYFYLRVVAGWDRQTAFFAATPGVTSYVIALAMQTPASIPQVAIVHTIRTFGLIIMLPLLISVIEPLEAGVMLRLPGDVVSSAVTIAAAAVVGYLLNWLRMPGGLLIGGLLGSGAVHLLELARGALPDIVLISGFVILGGVIGSRFAGFAPRQMAGVVGSAIIVLVIGFGISLAAAGTVSWAFHRTFAELVLAFSPGAIDVTAVIAFAMGLDSVFVAAHQLFRFVFIAAVMSVVARWTVGRDS